MVMTLHSLQPKTGARRSKQRPGRGLGSKGTTAGRGQKGQSSRAGVGGLKRLGLRQTLLATPKMRGFNSGRAKLQIVNLEALNEQFIAGEIVSPKTLAKKGLVKDAQGGVKILGRGDVTLAVTVKHCQVSASVQTKITQAGGKVEV